MRRLLTPSDWVTGMLLFVFFVAVVNLAVGYALGAGLKPPSIARFLPQRAERPVIADIDDAAPLSRAAPATAPPMPTPREAAPLKAKPSAGDVMASLAAFRERLTCANVELDNNREDPERFEETATKLQVANHEYLDEAVEVIKHLDELGAAGDAVATATRDALSSGATKAAAISDEIDGIIEGGLTSESARQKLLDKSQSLKEVAIEAENSATQAAADASVTAPTVVKPTSAVADPTNPAAKVTNAEEIDRLFDNLEALLRDAEDDAVSHVAMVRIDPPSEAPRSELLTAALEASVAAIAKEVLDAGQTLVPGAPAFMLLEGDAYDQALRRIERLRQQVEATVFSFDGEEIQATVTCAFADAHKGDSREFVMTQLNEALGESGRLGNNKTFHHDGAFPTEASRTKVDVERRKMALV